MRSWGATPQSCNQKRWVKFCSRAVGLSLPPDDSGSESQSSVFISTRQCKGQVAGDKSGRVTLFEMLVWGWGKEGGGGAGLYGQPMVLPLRER